MWNLKFKGYFQCRLATDADDFVHPRGENGWTFAFDGEPDLDRVIRFQNPVAPRSHAPAAGVVVTEVNGDPAHALAGARVDLLTGPKFEGRNGLIAPAGKEPIAPFQLAIEKGAFRLTRNDDYDVTDVMARRSHLGKGVNGLSPAEARAIGVEDPPAFRRARLAALQGALLNETDPVSRSNLTARISQLANFNGPDDIQMFSLAFKVPYAHQLRHATTLNDPAQVLAGVDRATPWEISYWMGAWDADALQAYVDGNLLVPSL